jgi:branched-chain amino acid transport system substrate-binding protein
LDLAGYFIRRFDQRYGKQLWEFDYLENVSDFDMLLQKVKDRKPEAIFLPGYHNDSAMILKKSRQTGIDAVFIGADGWSGDLMYNIAGASLDGSYCCDHWHRDNPDPVSRRFVAAYEKRYGKLLSSGPALSYDATLLLADAISRANSFNPKNIRDALESTKDFHGVTGKITFNEQRNPSKCAVILKFEKNTVRYVKNVWTK